MAKCASSLVTALLLLGSATACAQAAPGQCGYDRWPVKILADKDRSRVDFNPMESTIGKLANIPIHEIPYPYDRRIEPEELHTYKIKGKLLRVTREQDSDLHILLSEPDDSQQRMIVEIPAPECARGTGFEDKYRSARNLAATLHKGDNVEVVGVAFFDFLHEQHGAARNGIELHPVLGIRVLRQNSVLGKEQK